MIWFSNAKTSFGYHQSNVDHILFSKSCDGKITILHCLCWWHTTWDYTKVAKPKGSLTREFKMKDWENSNFLGTKVTRSKSGVFISQHKYVLDLLEETNMLGNRSVTLPLEPITGWNWKVLNTTWEIIPLIIYQVGHSVCCKWGIKTGAGGSLSNSQIFEVHSKKWPTVFQTWCHDKRIRRIPRYTLGYYIFLGNNLVI